MQNHRAGYTGPTLFHQALARALARNGEDALAAPWALPVGEPIRAFSNARPLNHAIVREHDGFGLDGRARIRCGCGFIGAWRDESDDSMATKLREDEFAHGGINETRGY